MITRRHLVGLAAASALGPRACRAAVRSSAGLAQSHREAGRAVPARRRHRRGRAHPHQPAVGSLGPAGDRREQARRRQQYRRRAGRARRTRRLHHPDRARCRWRSTAISIQSLSYDSITDFAPVTMICQFPNLLVVPNSSPAKSVQELIAHGKANSGKLTFASSGIGTSPHLSGELFKRMAGFEMTHIPYRGVAPALNDVIPGRVDMMFNTAGGVLQQVRSRPGARARGQHRASGFRPRRNFRPSRNPACPASTSPPGTRSSCRSKTPPASSRRSTPTPSRSWPSPPSRRGSSRSASRSSASTPQQLGARLKAETEQWGPIIKAAGIKTETGS